MPLELGRSVRPRSHRVLLSSVSPGASRRAARQSPRSPRPRSNRTWTEVATDWQVTDPFAAARQRAVELKRQLLEAEGGALTVAEVAKRLGISRQAVDKRRRARKLLALETSRGFLYPAWQFGDEGVLHGLDRVLAALEAAPWTQASWFPSGDSRLGDARPLEALRRGQLQQVLRAAAAYGEQGAA
jgi:hypothetical protein